MHPHELVKVCVDELRLHTCSTDPYVRVRHHALCSVLLRGGGVRSCALIGAYCYYHMGQGFAKDEGTDVLWLPLDTLIRSIFHDRYRELTQNFVSAMPTNPMDYLSTNDVPFLREMRASAWSTDRKSILSEAFMIGSISPPHSFWQQISSCMLDCANPSTPLPSSFTVHVLKGCCDDVLGRAALEYEACLMGGRDGEFLCLLGKDCARTGRKIYRITGLGFSDGRDEDDTIADSDIYWHVVFKAVGSTTGADLYQPASQWLNVELTMANLRHIAAFARQMPSAGSLTGEFGRASLGDGWEVEWFIILQAGKKDLYEVLVKGRGIVGLPRDVLIGVNCRALV